MAVDDLIGDAELGGSGIILDDLGELLRLDSDGATEELGDVIAAHELAVVLRVVLREFEGTREMALAIVVGDEGACEVSIITTTGEDDPGTVAGPAMPALYIGGVQFVNATNLCGQGVHGALCFVEAVDGGIAFDVVGEAGQDVCGQIVLVVARDGRGLHRLSLCEVH